MPRAIKTEHTTGTGKNVHAQRGSSVIWARWQVEAEREGRCRDRWWLPEIPPDHARFAPGRRSLHGTTTMQATEADGSMSLSGGSAQYMYTRMALRFHLRE
jgi:hypothetical protein